VERLPAVENIAYAIHVIRGERVTLDVDLARLYGVSTERLPSAFTGHGCLIASNLLRSATAVKVSVLIVRAFVRICVRRSRRTMPRS
jgi:hypothetical protein